MSADPPYAHLLKRLPVQARSRARVEAILDATEALLAGGDPDAVTVRAVADAAGVPTGTIYQFFDDKPALLQALAVRYVAATSGTLADALADRRGGWQDDLERVVDAFADMLRDAPAARVLWLAGALDTTTRTIGTEADDAIARRLREHLTARAGARTGADVDETVGWRVLVSVVSALLKAAFIVDERGDPAILAETRRVARLYAAALLGVSAA